MIEWIKKDILPSSIAIQRALGKMSNEKLMNFSQDLKVLLECYKQHKSITFIRQQVFSEEESLVFALSAKNLDATQIANQLLVSQDLVDSILLEKSARLKE